MAGLMGVRPENRGSQPMSLREIRNGATLLTLRPRRAMGLLSLSTVDDPSLVFTEEPR